MIRIIYEDKQLLVVEKPAGMESQVSRGLEADMVSEIKKYLNNLYTKKGEPYVGVIHRLDKPVGGVMVYAKTQKAAAALSNQVQNRILKKKYQAVICGKLVDNVGNYVDNLLKDGKNNYSQVVDMGITGGKQAELNYRVLGTREQDSQILTLVEVELLTGRHHQIRVQFAAHGHPLWGDNKYNPLFGGRIPVDRADCEDSRTEKRRGSLALCSTSLSFCHPETGKVMTFEKMPEGVIFKGFTKEE